MLNINHNIGYRSDIDGLRAIAILAVVCFHAFPSLVPGGFVGVDVFFVISGYLICKIIMVELDAKKFSITNFYKRRIKRIFPALIIVLLSVYIFGWFSLFPDEFKQLSEHIAGSSVFISNFILLKETGYFDNAAETKPLLNLWSLAIEEQFYLFLPVALLILNKFKKFIIPTLFLLIIVSFVFNILKTNADPTYAFYNPITRFWELLLGCLLTCVESKTNILKFTNIVRTSFACVGIILIFYSMLFFSKATIFPGALALIPVLGSVLIIASGNQAIPNRWILSNRLLVYIGLISYPLYLWHWPLLSYIRIIESQEPSFKYRAIIVIVSFILAWATYTFIEKPIRFKKLQSARLPVILYGLMLIIGLTGYTIYHFNIVPNHSYMRNYAAQMEQLKMTPINDDECKKYIIAHGYIPYCRFNNIGSKNTIAIIGDSHAWITFPGLVEVATNMQKNLLVLASTGCPIFSGVSAGPNQERRKQCIEETKRVIDIVINSPEITDVFISTRGMLYIAGCDAFDQKCPHTLYNIDNETENNTALLFEKHLQKTIDLLVANGKHVFYILENPVLDIHPPSLLGRPFKIKNQYYSEYSTTTKTIKTVMQEQELYRNIVFSLKNVTIIDPLPLFCDDNGCVIIKNNKLLYKDHDHLSVNGSEFLARELLVKHIK